MNNPVLEAIYRRRSIREFTDQTVQLSDLHEIIKAGTWAPSGLNNQPWRFVTITAPETKAALSDLTRYGHIIKDTPALIAVYLDRDEMYNEVKDHQAAGACIQNMLLATEELGLGGVWLGEILNRKDEVNNVLALNDNLDLMAVIAIGYPEHRQQSSNRKEIDKLIIKEILEEN